MPSFAADVRTVLRVVDAAEQVVNPLLLQALVAAEDRRFYFHCGVDLIAITRAITHWVLWRKLEGASTIEAQLFRTVTDRREVELTRKLREAAAAILIALLRSKTRIAAAYLDVAYFGFDPKGIKFALEKLAIDAQSLQVVDACDLVCRLKRPSRHEMMHPGNEALRKRIEWLMPKIICNSELLVVRGSS